MHDSLVVAFEIKRPWPNRRGKSGYRYWPALVTVWHREPGDADALSVCKHGTRWQLHIHHWRLQFPPLQALRRRLLTRCAWCGGRSRKGDPVNISHSRDGPRGHWWQGEPGLYHHDCSAVQEAHRLCLCPDPLLRHGNYGECALCGRFRPYGRAPDEADRLLASLPAGTRIPAAVRPQIEALWDERRRRREAA